MFNTSKKSITRGIFICLVLGSYYCLKTLVIVSNREKLEEQNLVYYGLSSTESSRDSPSTHSSQHLVTESSNELNLNLLFNDSCAHILGPPDWVQKQCTGNETNSCSKLTCYDILRHTNDDIYKISSQFMTKYKKKFLSDSQLQNLTNNCSNFRQQYGYYDEQNSPSNEDFPIAFNLIVHKDAHQVERLLRSIYRPHNVYCIHVDAAAKPTFRGAMSALAECFENVRLSSKSEIVSWGGYSRLQADINCMMDHMSSKVLWKYLINTAGQAFPLKTVEEMVRVLKIYNGANDIEGIYGARVLRGRFENEWKEDTNMRSVTKTGRRNPSPPHSIDIVRGSAYGIFSRDFVKFILEDQRAKDLRSWSISTWSPDEFYWSTLHHTYSNPHLHTPGAYSGHPSRKPWLAVYANWDSGSCHGQSVRGVCVFGVEDLPDLLIRREFFANKFYSNFQPLALDCLESWVKHKEQCPVEFDESFYRSLPFIYRDDR